MRGMKGISAELPDTDLPRDGRVLGLMLPFLWPRDDFGMRLRLVLSVLLLVVGAALAAFAPVVMSWVVDRLAAPAEIAVALPLGLLVAYAGTATLTKALVECRLIMYGPIEQRLRRSIGVTVFRHLHDLSLGFHLARKTGQLSRIIDNGSRGIDQILFLLVFNVLPLVAQILIIVFVLLGKFPPLYAVIIIATFALYVGALIGGASWMRRHQRDAVMEGVAAHGKAVDSLLNYETVKYFGRERLVADRYDQALHSVERLQVRAMVLRSLTGVLQVVILGGGQLVMLVLAAQEVVAGRSTVGAFVLVNMYLLQLIQPLDRMGTVYRMLKQAFTEVEQMMGLLKVAPEIRDRPGAVPLPAGPGAIDFEGVSFAYDPRREVLTGVSFRVPAGTSIGLVGASGAGKTTIGRLLFRFYDPTAGSVAIDGWPTGSVTAESLRAAIGVVPQDAVLFDDTLLYNLAFAHPDATRADIEAAARGAQIHDFIVSLPDGYDTVVGERGLKLSGGERQRIAIARVILKRPRILLFDEATSALDSRTEHAIHESLRTISRGTTTMIIAHRLSSVVHADQIVLLADGRIAERGTHETLLREGGRYAALWARQMRQQATGQSAASTAPGEAVG